MAPFFGIEPEPTPTARKVMESEAHTPILIDERQVIAHPNPFGEKVSFLLQLDHQAKLTLEVFDLAGEKMTSLVDRQNFPQGKHTLTWEAQNVPAGVYFYCITIDEARQVFKLIKK